MNPSRDIGHLIKLAAQNIDRGVIEEPRYFFDVIPILTGQQISKDDPHVFLNGEEFPVRITQLSLALRPDFVNNTGLDDTALQRIGLRLVFHDTYYQSRLTAPAPLWANKVTTGPVSLSRGFISNTFDRPVILSARDSLRVQVALEIAPTQGQTMRASVGFHGVGLQSMRPYFLHSFRDLDGVEPTVLQTADFRNDGAEPIALTDMVVQLGGESASLSGLGDIRRLRVQIRQLGNGTGRDWVVYPTLQQPNTPLPQIPAHFLGFTEGVRAIVHQFPGDGILFEPGEGVTVEAVGINNNVAGLALGVTLAGYIAVV